jgi:16S rRNA (uracil1498-N3)-methyltransferase
MTLPRFHVDLPLHVGEPTMLPRAQTRHALRALRLRQGEMLTVFDGRGGEYVARLIEAREPEAEIQITGFEPRECELPWFVTVAQGLSSGDKMDWTVEKAIELGASAIAPLGMARSVLRLSGDRATSRRAHWQALAIAASEQCGRNRVAAIEPVRALDDWLASLPDAALRLVLVPDGEPLRDVQRPAGDTRIVLLVGPEGGFADHELQAVDRAGFRAISLGPRVLRTETAAPVALAMLSALWDGGRPG